MSGLFEVLLNSFPAERKVHVERVVHKHNRSLSHQQYHALVAEVAGGTAKVVGSFAHEQNAENLVKELAYHSAKAEIRAPEAADS